MKNTNQLKEQLLKISSNEWTFPQDINLYELALDMMSNIGSTDSELRDDLILTGFYHLIGDEKLSGKELKGLLDISLSDKHLFYKLGEEEDDSVFNRAFTILVLQVIIDYHNSLGANLLSHEEMDSVYDKIINYIRHEKDLRGHVNIKGWAHAIAHSGDALRELAVCSYLSKQQLMGILEVIKEKVSISNYVYINEEAERLVTAIVKVIERKELEDSEVIGWIRSFANIEIPSNYPEAHYFKENIKNLLRSLFFRVKFKYPQSAFTSEIEAVLHGINSRFNEYSK
ncbi:DUF2785 domain-containing protein [Alkaliphilus peptidifermentans]|uniref:DUF2785 domain-containing protein n=1 Tax=Alkaliphilus peptidifermentans DSM 18978 TaxID=1120976 RepID=A0A1G5FW38_9FIRM|nr:DUF2785 domain-containing protein [Alkaliphilus peptidifermentans]SCY43456.1 Protein of unknown function [Alkaliphilus peptidifermentans DSM 18978]